MQRAALYLLLLVVAVLRRRGLAAPVQAPPVPLAKPIDLGSADEWALAGGW